MIFCFSGTGNSRYIAQRIAEALHEPVIDLNAKIKDNDTTAVDTGRNVIMVTPTYAWRIPKIVSEWMAKTKWTGAKRIWFVMDCGGGIGNAAKYNRNMAVQKGLRYMGTAQIVMPENYIALFHAPEPEEARKITAKAEPDILAAIQYIQNKQKFPAPRNSLYDRFMSGPVNVKADNFRVSEACTGCGQCVRKCPLNNIRLKGKKPMWGKTVRIVWPVSVIARQKPLSMAKRALANQGINLKN